MRQPNIKYSIKNIKYLISRYKNIFYYQQVHFGAEETVEGFGRGIYNGFVFVEGGV